MGVVSTRDTTEEHITNGYKTQDKIQTIVNRIKEKSLQIII